MGWGVASHIFQNITLKQLRFRALVMKFPGQACNSATPSITLSHMLCRQEKYNKIISFREIKVQEIQGKKNDPLFSRHKPSNIITRCSLSKVQSDKAQ